MAAFDAPISHAALAAMLAEDERMALSFRDSTLADEQAVAIDYYEARPFGEDGGRAALGRDARRSRGGRIRARKPAEPDRRI